MTRTNLLTALAIVCLALPMAHGQTGPISPTGSVQPVPPPAAPKVSPPVSAPAATTPGTVMNDQALQDFLRKLDPKVVLGNQQGFNNYSLNVKSKSFNVPMRVVDQKGVLWMEINLGPLGNVSALPPGTITELLKTHTQVGPTFLAVKHEVPHLYLLHRVDRGITAERLQSAIDEFIGDLENSQKLWQTLLQK